MKRLVVGALLAGLSFVARDARAVEVTGVGLVNPLGYIAGVNMEFGVGEAVGIEVSGQYMEYEYEDTGYYEEGWGPVFGIRTRYYAQSAGDATRLWIGGGLSAADITVYWEERESGVLVDSEEKDVTMLVVTGAIGYKVLFGDGRFVIDPQLFLGYLSNAETDTNVIAGLGLSAGLRF